MNVLVINGSPKGGKSNTMCLTNAFLKGAGFENAEIINVCSADIKSCLGCFSCWNKTPGKCIINDEMSGILEKIIASDIIIWSFPLYYFSVPGGLKNLIDRQLPMSLPFMSAENESGGHPARYDLSHQKHIIISTCGFWTPKGNYDAVISMFDHFVGRESFDIILCGQGELFRIPELKQRCNSYLEVVALAGGEFASGGISPKTHSELEKPLFPRETFETMADASWNVPQEGDSKAETDDSLSFTKQMAALYNPDGKERVVELFYTDINKTYQMLLSKDGSEVIADGLKEYTTRIETPYSVWRSIARGEISGQEALFQKKYSVEGDFNLMLSWDNLFGGASASNNTSHAPKKGKEKKTDMTLVLLPWIAIWIALAISPKIGGIIGVLVSALLPLLWLRFKAVVYEQISVPLVSALSLSAILGADMQIILPLSYALFGAMWLISSFLKTPLTAYYSANNYGGDSAHNNPLFMHTNRILTAAWGVLYLVSTIWTYFLMGTSLSTYTGLINSICPALMGVFTMWFQKWYPAHWASKSVR
ncbi:NAD(P)H-dependent oxidoreductase [Clostridiaceae bacterium OttesenSCG-928-D20]|nr:NAD(P)H-dependent oxidoreductase [Clostridiaceae bacterium OttesenSCG-928-D20]